MTNNIKESSFFKKSKFQKDFILSENLDLYKIIVERYECYIKDKDVAVDKYKIPFIIHQIWMGSALPSKYKSWSKHLQRLNPDFQYILWDEESILSLDFKEKPLFEMAKNWAVKSDIARLAILKSYGGIYLDTDFEPIKPFPLAMFKERFVACLDFNNKYQPSINNAIFASEKNGRVLSSICDKIRLPENNKPDSIFEMTGPHLFSRVMQESLRNAPSDILVLPSNYFYFIPSFALDKSQTDALSIMEDEVIVIHHWDISWLPFRIKIKGKIIEKFPTTVKIIKKIICR